MNGIERADMMDVIALQPMWVQIWVTVLATGIFILPLILLIWRPARLAGVVSFIAAFAGGMSVTWMYAQLGYVKLLGLPHIFFWTPLVIFLWMQVHRADMPDRPRFILWLLIALFSVSLIFDYADAIRYILGERTPFDSEIAA